MKLNESVHSTLLNEMKIIELEIKRNEDEIDNLEWDISCARTRIEHLTIRYKEIETFLKEVKTND